MTTLRILFIAMLALWLAPEAWSQSQTTGTLNLRNIEQEAVSLSIPPTGVTGYTLLLPSTNGVAGQAMTISAITGTTAELSWTDAAFWSLTGSTITAAGTGPGEQYLGTANDQDLVLASNGTEALRIVGTAGPTQGYIGLGTSAPQAPIDLAGTVLLSNSGTATELRFAEPSADGTEYTAFKAGAQTASITYTLPLDAPSGDGLILTTDASGQLTWDKPFSRTPMGVYVPDFLAWQHVINVGPFGPNAIPFVSMMNPAGTTIGLSVTDMNAVNGTITVETSIPLGVADRICWMILEQ